MAGGPTSLDGKVAMVTGGGSGIGRAIAMGLAQSGARVVINDMSESGQETADEIGGAFLQADLADMDETRGLCQRALELEGRIDILVNNAGFQHMSPVEDFPDERWAKLIQVMLIAPFQMTKYALPGMKERGWGRIINMSSIHGLIASPFKSAYVSAKHGIVGLTKTVALETGEHGVTVNAICPAYVRTPLVEAQIADQARMMNLGEDEVTDKVMLAPAAIKHLVDPEEVAAVALFLASDDARSITGACYTIDLGWTAR